MTTITVIPAATGQSEVCAPILRALPQWFGIEAANQMYIRDIDANPTYVAQADGQPVGFLTYVRHFAQAAEIHVMGVLPGMHRQGVGRALVQQLEHDLREQGVQFLQVKTLSSKHPDPGYARTRAFYEGVGFLPFEEFPDLWGEHNPCLQMLKLL